MIIVAFVVVFIVVLIALISGYLIYKLYIKKKSVAGKPMNYDNGGSPGTEEE